MWDKGINGRAPEGGDFTKRSQACYTLSNSEWEKGGILFLQPRYQTGKAIDRECAGGEMLSGARSNHRLPCILIPGCGGRQTTPRPLRVENKEKTARSWYQLRAALSADKVLRRKASQDSAVRRQRNPILRGVSP